VGLLAVALLGAAGAQAASVSYDLTISNDPWNIYIPDGTAYARVTIDDEGAAGLINFTVTILDSILSQNALSNFGLQSFGFNAVDGTAADALAAADIVNLPTGWSADVNHYAGSPPPPTGIALDGFGRFDAAVSDGGSNRQNPTLTFAVDLGLDQSATDTIFDYIAGSDGGANGSYLFAAHIVGFADLNPLDPLDDPYDGTGECYDLNPPDEDWTLGCNILTSTWVSGSTPSVVPVPAAVWLFGSALGLLGWLRRKRV
jgi:hypothetical protein